MRVSYFGYCVLDRESGTKHRVDLRPFVRGFVGWQNSDAKARLQYNDERLFLLPLSGPVNLFVQSRDQEVIKRVERRRYSANDIHDILGANDSIGFASYILLGKSTIGIATKVLSPRMTAFASFMTDLFLMLGANKQFIPVALTETLPAQDVQHLEHVGAVSIEMNVSNPIAIDALNLLSGGARQAYDDVAAVEIRIVPKRRGHVSLRNLLMRMARNVPIAGLEGLEARARREAQDAMTDVYIVGAGGLKDDLRTERESEIAAEMARVARQNRKLAEKVREFEEDQRFETADSAAAIGLDWGRLRDGYVAPGRPSRDGGQD